MDENPTLVREKSDFVEMRSTLRVMEQPPTLTPSVPVLAVPMVLSPANIVLSVSTPNIYAPQSG